MSYQGTRYYDLLLANMLRNQAILQLAAGNLQAAFFADPRIGGTQLQSTIFHAIVSYYAVYRSAPDLGVLQVEVLTLMDRCLGPDPAVRTAWATGLFEFVRFLPVVTDESLPMTRDIIAHMTKTCVYNDKMASVLNEALTTGEYEGLEAKLSVFNNEQRGVSGGLAVSGIGTAVAEDQTKLIRTKLHIPFLDELFYRGNGPPTGSAMAILSVQGGGKTTSGIQICTSACLMGRNAVLILAEEGLTATMRRNLRAAITGIPTTTLESMGDNWEKAAEVAGISVETVRTKLQLMDKHLHVLDLIDNPMGLDQIEAELQRIVENGKAFDVIYSDWAGLMADYLMSNTPKGGRKFESKESALKYVGDRVAAWAPKFNCLSVISQQMAPSIAVKGPTHVYDQYCAQDCKGFTQSMKYVLVIGPRHDGTGLQFMGMPKARNDKPGQRVMVRLVGEKQTFLKAEGFEARGKSFYKVGKDAEPSVPKENAKAKEGANAID